MPKGGKRPGAGRPKGSGKWGESTVSIRLPAWAIKLLPKWKKPKPLPVMYLSLDAKVERERNESAVSEVADNPTV